MKCRTCGSTMVEDHREQGASVTACWHSCPLCRTQRLTSAPDALDTAHLQRDDDAAYAGDFSLSGLDVEA